MYDGGAGIFEIYAVAGVDMGIIKSIVKIIQFSAHVIKMAIAPRVALDFIPGVNSVPSRLINSRFNKLRFTRDQYIIS